MLVKLIRPLLESGWNTISLRSLTTSSVFFQQSFSGTNTGGSSKPTEKIPNLKNQQQTEKKNKSRTELNNEQEQSQQEGPADKKAERTSSSDTNKSTKSKK